MGYVLGLDLGTSSLKGLLVNKKGDLVYSTSADYPLIQPQKGYSEQNPEEWFQAAITVLEATLTAIPDARDQLEAISFSGQMHSLVLLDEADQVVRNAILWNDVRTTQQCERIKETLGDKLIPITKNKALEALLYQRFYGFKKRKLRTLKRPRHSYCRKTT